MWPKKKKFVLSAEHGFNKGGKNIAISYRGAVISIWILFSPCSRGYSSTRTDYAVNLSSKCDTNAYSSNECNQFSVVKRQYF